MSPPPPQVLVAAAAAAVLLLVSGPKRKIKQQPASRQRQGTHGAAATAATHAAAAAAAGSASAGAGLPAPAYVTAPPVTAATGVPISRLMPLLLSTLLIGAATGACIMRGSYDVAAAVGFAWIMLLMAQQGGLSGMGAASLVGGQQLAGSAPGQEPAVLPDITGVWIKDHARSDSLEPAMALLKLNGVVRTAVKLVRGMDVVLDPDTGRFDLAIFSVISFFKVVERYSLSGAVSHCKRRDFRRGKHRGVARATPHGTLLLSYEWDDPLAGAGTDEFALSPDGLLLVTTNVSVGARSARYTQAYVRRGAGGSSGDAVAGAPQ